jgi:hypothetical protein
MLLRPCLGFLRLWEELEPLSNNPEGFRKYATVYRAHRVTPSQVTLRLFRPKELRPSPAIAAPARHETFLTSRLSSNMSCVTRLRVCVITHTKLVISHRYDSKQAL